jgi:1-aminocyclopropane-1-carboxylate deaminase/D-cysteine desulfhydrase-like pyridoxal-dependent ACC family enzyme
VEYAPRVSRAIGRDVFVKRDDLTNARYGGNKIRKLVHLLADAQSRGATDLVTLGAVGSHHVLATTVHGAALGMATHAVLVRQPYTPHVEETVRADLAQGASLHVARGAWDVPIRIASIMARLRARGRRPYLVPLGGSSAVGARGYVDAAREIEAQMACGEAPRCDAMYVPLGSGGTLAGLLGGARAFGITSRIVGVRVTDRWMTSRVTVAYLARGAARRAGVRVRVHASDVEIDHDHVGAGYGHATDDARRALDLFGEDGFALDLTYTAKTAAALITRARAAGASERHLFWHTLSSAPMEPLLTGKPTDLPRAILESFARAS